MKKVSISSENANFWDELCGTTSAISIGISDASLISLKKFDSWYFDSYPYLFNQISFQDLSNKDVLEVGLGYGTVSQKIAESGANYCGLDIAAGPVSMVNHRLKINNLQGQAVQGSILEPPFLPNSFDTIIAIGCLHHTGDLQRAIDQCHNLLRSNGQLIFMVYYAYSYRRWLRSPLLTLVYAIKEFNGFRSVVGSSAKSDRAAYDKNSSGRGAPHTDWISKKSLQNFCLKFSQYTLTIENIDQRFPPFFLWKRKTLLKMKLTQKIGLDLYVNAIKK